MTLKQRAVKMTDEQWAHVQRAAHLEEMSAGQWVRRAIRAQLEREALNAEAPPRPIAASAPSAPFASLRAVPKTSQLR